MCNVSFLQSKKRKKPPIRATASVHYIASSVVMEGQAAAKPCMLRVSEPSLSQRTSFHLWSSLLDALDSGRLSVKALTSSTLSRKYSGSIQEGDSDHPPQHVNTSPLLCLFKTDAVVSLMET